MGMYEVTDREAPSVKPKRFGQIPRTGTAQAIDVTGSRLLLSASCERGASCSQCRDHPKTNYSVLQCTLHFLFLNHSSSPF